MAAHGRYNLLRKIADGGTAEVFLAHMEGSAGFKRLVVLKRVRPNLWADEAFRRGLLDEAHIMMGLHHGNIVQVLDVGLAANRYFLAFELVDGWTLAQVVSRAKKAQLHLPLNLALHVMAETCRALAYAHSRGENGVPLGIVHRDVSPQNVLLSEQGEVKLADFGIARARTRATTSQVGTVKGKPAFMSPEQASGRAIDARSDLFPIGTMLYQLVTGELPFTAPTALEEMTRVVQGKFVPPEQKRPDLPAEFARLINRALEHSVEKRFQSADEMVVAIEKVQRTVLEAAGQTELKSWLAALAAKDGALPLSRAGLDAPSAQPDLVTEQVAEQVIELTDEDIVTLTPIKSSSSSSSPSPSPSSPSSQSGAPQPSQPPRAPPDAQPGRGWAILMGLGLVLVVAGAVQFGPEFLRDKASDPPKAPPIAAPVPAAVAVTPPVVAAVMDAGSSPPKAAEIVPADAGSANAEEVPTRLATNDPLDAGSPERDDAGTLAAADEALGAEPTKADDALAAVDAGRGKQDAPPVVAVARPAPGPRGAEVEPVRAPAEVKSPRAPPAPAPAKAPAPAPAKPVAPPDDTISVLFESEPAGAQVRIDKHLFGQTPIPLKLKIGITFELVFNKPGYKEKKLLQFVTRKPGQRARVVLEAGR